MLGIILCGGQSTRMGTDKGLLKLQSATWAETAATTLGQLRLPVLFSVNSDQYNYYITITAENKLVKDDSSIEVRGPLQGLLSVHQKYPMEDLFILACDMPLMRTVILQQLLDYSNTLNAEAYVCETDGEYEPLCGIYTVAALNKTLKMLREGKLAKYSIRYILDQVNTFSLPLATEQKKYFRNFNAPADLSDL